MVQYHAYNYTKIERTPPTSINVSDPCLKEVLVIKKTNPRNQALTYCRLDFVISAPCSVCFGATAFYTNGVLHLRASEFLRL